MAEEFRVRHSLRTQVTAITVCAIFATLLACFAVSFFTVGQGSGANAAEKMRLIGENARQSINAYLSSVEQSVAMASHIAVDSLDGVVLVENGVGEPPTERTEEQQSALDACLTQSCQDVQKAFNSVADCTNGIVTYYYCINPDVSVAEHGFFYSKVGKAGFEEREPLDARTLDPDDTEHTVWYYGPINRGLPTWVGPYKAHFLDELMTESYLIPIYKAGTLIGVLGMDIAFETITSKVDSVKVYETGFACLLDQDDKVLYHPELPSESDAEAAMQEIAENGIVAEAADEPVRYSVKGADWQYSYSTLANGMKLVVTAPLAEIDAMWRQLALWILLILILVLGVFIPIVVLGMRTIIRPLQRLTDAALKIAGGDYEVQLDYDRDDEVGLLTHAFRQMSDRQRSRMSDLNSRVFVDALTRVKNKHAFDATAESVNKAIRSGSPEDMPEFALMMFDCNELKEVNDEFGHARGDIYLKAASALICHVYDHSPVYRMGGDEFVVLLRNEDYRNREDLLAEFDRRAGEINASASNPWERVDMARGMSQFHPGEDSSVEDVLRRADSRMYADKRTNRR